MDGAIGNMIVNTGGKWRKTRRDGKEIHSPDIVEIYS